MKKTKEECLLMNGIMSYELGKNEARIMKALDDWAEDVVKNLSSDPVLAAGWISVNEKLPDNENSFCNDVVLFWSKKHGFPMVGCYDYELSKWTRLPWERGYKSLSFEDVTHWMPLPERPPACT